jgi:hypothetical protein
MTLKDAHDVRTPSAGADLAYGTGLELQGGTTKGREINDGAL